MRTDFQNYLIDKIADSIEGFAGDMERYGEVFGFTYVDLLDLEDDNTLTFDHIGFWVVVMNQDGQLELTRLRTHDEAIKVWDELNAHYLAWEHEQWENGNNVN